MEADEILIAKTAPAITYESSWWRFCVKADGRFEYQKMSWREKTGESTETTTGKLSSEEQAAVRQIIETLDDVELEDFVIEDAGSSTIDYRRADRSTASIEQCGEPTEGDAENDVFANAWLAIKRIADAHTKGFPWQDPESTNGLANAKWLIYPILALRGKFNPRNINHMPADKFFLRVPYLEQII